MSSFQYLEINKNKMMQTNYNEEQKYILAKKRVEKIKGFYIHLSVYIIVNIFLSSMIIYGLSTDSDGEYTLWEAFTHIGVYSTWFFWGIGIFFHWMGVFGFKSFISKNWEEKTIKELMDEEDKRSKRF